MIKPKLYLASNTLLCVTIVLLAVANMQSHKASTKWFNRTMELTKLVREYQEVILEERNTPIGSRSLYNNTTGTYSKQLGTDTNDPNAGFLLNPNPNGHNICIGPEAGRHLTTQSYEFRLKISPNEPEYRTTMTPEEYEIIKGVLDRLEYVYSTWP